MNAYFVVGIVFIILKLCDLISWSWVWVLSPFIAYLAVLFVSLFAVMTHHKRVMRSNARMFARRYGFK